MLLLRGGLAFLQILLWKLKILHLRGVSIANAFPSSGEHLVNLMSTLSCWQDVTAFCYLPKLIIVTVVHFLVLSQIRKI